MWVHCIKIPVFQDSGFNRGSASGSGSEPNCVKKQIFFLFLWSSHWRSSRKYIGFFSYDFLVKKPGSGLNPDQGSEFSSRSLVPNTDPTNPFHSTVLHVHRENDKLSYCIMRISDKVFQLSLFILDM